MVEFRSDIVSRLYAELRFAPRRQQEKELEASRELAQIVDTEKEYPFEFVCFKLTGYRPREDMSGRFVRGEDLAHDLQIIINKVSRKVAPQADEYPEKVYTVDELAREMSVSGKTIRRWRQRGLMGWMFVFDGGKKKLGFPESAVREFTDANPEITENASNFSKLSNAERKRIVDLAAKFARDENLSRYQVILQVAKETGRARETIRCELINYENENPRRKIFSKAAGVIRPEDAKEIYRLYREGTGVKELMKMYGRSRSSIYRIINKRRWKALSRSKIDFIDSAEFLLPETAEGITASGEKLLRQMQNSPVRLLNRQEETELFRFYNFLKRAAFGVRARIEGAKVSGRLLTEAESFLRRGEEVKRVLIEANLGLVVSVARKHFTANSPMPELISEGNLALMRAVEKFDYTRGHRFSTYATLAIAKDYATKIPAEVARQDRAGDVDSAEFSEDVRSLDFASIVEIERANHSLARVIKNNLTEREQYVIRNHFGLEGNRITKKAKTLEDIGKTLGLSKERVRQIELIALQQLRHCLSPKEFDLLMK